METRASGSKVLRSRGSSKEVQLTTRRERSLSAGKALKSSHQTQSARSVRSSTRSRENTPTGKDSYQGGQDSTSDGDFLEHNYARSNGASQDGSSKIGNPGGSSREKQRSTATVRHVPKNDNEKSSLQDVEKIKSLRQSRSTVKRSLSSSSTQGPTRKQADIKTVHTRHKTTQAVPTDKLQVELLPRLRGRSASPMPSQTQEKSADKVSGKTVNLDSGRLVHRSDKEDKHCASKVIPDPKVIESDKKIQKVKSKTSIPEDSKTSSAKESESEIRSRLRTSSSSRNKEMSVEDAAVSKSELDTGKVSPFPVHGDPVFSGTIIRRPRGRPFSKNRPAPDRLSLHLSGIVKRPRGRPFSKNRFLQATLSRQLPVRKRGRPFSKNLSRDVSQPTTTPSHNNTFTEEVTSDSVTPTDLLSANTVVQKRPRGRPFSKNRPPSRGFSLNVHRETPLTQNPVQTSENSAQISSRQGIAVSLIRRPRGRPFSKNRPPHLIGTPSSSETVVPRPRGRPFTKNILKHQITRSNTGTPSSGDSNLNTFLPEEITSPTKTTDHSTTHAEKDTFKNADVSSFLSVNKGETKPASELSESTTDSPKTVCRPRGRPFSKNIPRPLNVNRNTRMLRSCANKNESSPELTDPSEKTDVSALPTPKLEESDDVSLKDADKNAGSSESEDNMSVSETSESSFESPYRAHRPRGRIGRGLLFRIRGTRGNFGTGRVKKIISRPNTSEDSAIRLTRSKDPPRSTRSGRKYTEELEMSSDPSPIRRPRLKKTNDIVAVKTESLPKSEPVPASLDVAKTKQRPKTTLNNGVSETQSDIKTSGLDDNSLPKPENCENLIEKAKDILPAEVSDSDNNAHNNKDECKSASDTDIVINMKQSDDTDSVTEAADEHIASSSKEECSESEENSRKDEHLTTESSCNTHDSMETDLLINTASVDLGEDIVDHQETESGLPFSNYSEGIKESSTAISGEEIMKDGQKTDSPDTTQEAFSSSDTVTYSDKLTEDTARTRISETVTLTEPESESSLSQTSEESSRKPAEDGSVELSHKPTDITEVNKTSIAQSSKKQRHFMDAFLESSSRRNEDHSITNDAKMTDQKMPCLKPVVNKKALSQLMAATNENIRKSPIALVLIKPLPHNMISEQQRTTRNVKDKLSTDISSISTTVVHEESVTLPEEKPESVIQTDTSSTDISTSKVSEDFPPAVTNSECSVTEGKDGASDIQDKIDDKEAITSNSDALFENSEFGATAVKDRATDIQEKIDVEEVRTSNSDVLFENSVCSVTECLDRATDIQEKIDDKEARALFENSECYMTENKDTATDIQEKSDDEEARKSNSDAFENSESSVTECNTDIQEKIDDKEARTLFENSECHMTESKDTATDIQEKSDDEESRKSNSDAFENSECSLTECKDGVTAIQDKIDDKEARASNNDALYENYEIGVTEIKDRATDIQDEIDDKEARTLNSDELFENSVITTNETESGENIENEAEVPPCLNQSEDSTSELEENAAKLDIVSSSEEAAVVSSYTNKVNNTEEKVENQDSRTEVEASTSEHPAVVSSEEPPPNEATESFAMAEDKSDSAILQSSDDPTIDSSAVSEDKSDSAILQSSDDPTIDSAAVAENVSDSAILKSSDDPTTDSAAVSEDLSDSAILQSSDDPTTDSAAVAEDMSDSAIFPSSDDPTIDSAAVAENLSDSAILQSSDDPTTDSKAAAENISDSAILQSSDDPTTDSKAVAEDVSDSAIFPSSDDPTTDYSSVKEKTDDQILEINTEQSTDNVRDAEPAGLPLADETKITIEDDDTTEGTDDLPYPEKNESNTIASEPATSQHTSEESSVSEDIQEVTVDEAIAEPEIQQKTDVLVTNVSTPVILNIPTFTPVNVAVTRVENDEVSRNITSDEVDIHELSLLGETKAVHVLTENPSQIENIDSKSAEDVVTDSKCADVSGIESVDSKQSTTDAEDSSDIMEQSTETLAEKSLKTTTEAEVDQVSEETSQENEDLSKNEVVEKVELTVHIDQSSEPVPQEQENSIASPTDVGHEDSVSGDVHDENSSLNKQNEDVDSNISSKDVKLPVTDTPAVEQPSSIPVDVTQPAVKKPPVILPKPGKMTTRGKRSHLVFALTSERKRNKSKTLNLPSPSAPTAQAKSNIKEMLTKCKPCKVVLIDFVKYLNLCNLSRHSVSTEHIAAMSRKSPVISEIPQDNCMSDSSAEEITESINDDECDTAKSEDNRVELETVVEVPAKKPRLEKLNPYEKAFLGFISGEKPASPEKPVRVDRYFEPSARSTEPSEKTDDTEAATVDEQEEKQINNVSLPLVRPQSQYKVHPPSRPKTRSVSKPEQNTSSMTDSSQSRTESETEDSDDKKDSTGYGTFVACKFKCKHCVYVTNTRSIMAEHIYNHTDVVPYKCGICGAIFGTRSGILVHHRREHGIQQHVIIKDTTVEPEIHYTVVRELRKFQTSFARNRIQPQAGAVTVDLTDSPPKQTAQQNPVMANILNLGPAVRDINVADLYNRPVSPPQKKKRIMVPTETTDPNVLYYQCRHCTYSSNNQQNLEKHVIVLHKEERRYMCPLCDLVYYRFESEMKRHFQRKHPSQPVIIQMEADYYPVAKKRRRETESAETDQRPSLKVVLKANTVESPSGESTVQYSIASCSVPTEGSTEHSKSPQPPNSNTCSENPNTGGVVPINVTSDLSSSSSGSSSRSSTPVVRGDIATALSDLSPVSTNISPSSNRLTEPRTNFSSRSPSPGPIILKVPSISRRVTSTSGPQTDEDSSGKVSVSPAINEKMISEVPEKSTSTSGTAQPEYVDLSDLAVLDLSKKSTSVAPDPVVEKPSSVDNEQPETAETRGSDYMCREVSSTSEDRNRLKLPPLGTSSNKDLQAKTGVIRPFTATPSLASASPAAASGDKEDDDSIKIVDVVSLQDTAKDRNQEEIHYQYQCNMCPLVLPYHEAMIYHIDHNHRIDFRYACPYCPYGFTKQKNNMYRHIRRAHPTLSYDVQINLADEENYFTKKTVKPNEKVQLQKLSPKPAPVAATVTAGMLQNRPRALVPILPKTIQIPSPDPVSMPTHSTDAGEKDDDIIFVGAESGTSSSTAPLAGANASVLPLQGNSSSSSVASQGIKSTAAHQMDNFLDMDCEAVDDSTQRPNDSVTEDDDVIISRQSPPRSVTETQESQPVQTLNDGHIADKSVPVIINDSSSGSDKTEGSLVNPPAGVSATTFTAVQQQAISQLENTAPVLQTVFPLQQFPGQTLLLNAAPAILAVPTLDTSRLAPVVNPPASLSSEATGGLATIQQLTEIAQQVSPMQSLSASPVTSVPGLATQAPLLARPAFTTVMANSATRPRFQCILPRPPGTVVSPVKDSSGNIQQVRPPLLQAVPMLQTQPVILSQPAIPITVLSQPPPPPLTIQNVTVSQPVSVPQVITTSSLSTQRPLTQPPPLIRAQIVQPGSLTTPRLSLKPGQTVSNQTLSNSIIQPLSISMPNTSLVMPSSQTQSSSYQERQTGQQLLASSISTPVTTSAMPIVSSMPQANLSAAAAAAANVMREARDLVGEPRVALPPGGLPDQRLDITKRTELASVAKPPLKPPASSQQEEDEEDEEKEKELFKVFNLAPQRGPPPTVHSQSYPQAHPSALIGLQQMAHRAAFFQGQSRAMGHNMPIHPSFFLNRQRSVSRQTLQERIMGPRGFHHRGPPVQGPGYRTSGGYISRQQRQQLPGHERPAPYPQHLAGMRSHMQATVQHRPQMMPMPRSARPAVPATVPQIQKSIPKSAPASHLMKEQNTPHPVVRHQVPEHELDLNDSPSSGANKSHPCPHCPFKSPEPEDLYDHILTHGSLVRWSCPYCPTPNQMEKQNVARHIQLSHPGRKIIYIPYGVPY